MPWRDWWTCGKREADYYYSTFRNRNSSTSFPIQKSCKRAGKETALLTFRSMTYSPSRALEPRAGTCSMGESQRGGFRESAQPGHPREGAVLHFIRSIWPRSAGYAGGGPAVSPTAALIVLLSRVSRNMCVGSLLHAKKHCYLLLKHNLDMELELNSSSINWCANYSRILQNTVVSYVVDCWFF